MIVVSDTTPLNYLVLIGAAELPPRLYQRVLTPPAVIDELRHRGTPTPCDAGSNRRPRGSSFKLPYASIHAFDSGEEKPRR